MHRPHKKKLPRLDLKARIHAAGFRKLTQFARSKRINVRTLHAVLDGARSNGPEATRIINLITDCPAK